MVSPAAASIAQGGGTQVAEQALAIAAEIASWPIVPAVVSGTAVQVSAAAVRRFTTSRPVLEGATLSLALIAGLTAYAST